MTAAELNAFRPGVTVIEDAASPTGYTAVFLFDEHGLTPEYLDYILRQYHVDLRKALDLTRITRVAVYSNTAWLYDYGEMPADHPLDPAQSHAPQEYRPGLYPAGGDTSAELFGGAKVNFAQECVFLGDGRWGCAFPLTSGATDYNIRLGDAFGRTDGTYLYDPANPPMYNEVSRVYSRSSMVWVPHAACEGDRDRSVENPDPAAPKGRIEYVPFEENNSIAVYLPAGYDPNRAEPYKVLYLSHGAQAEFLGSELRWLHECAGENIFNNLGVDFLVVTMNNIHNGGENTRTGIGGLWNMDSICEAQKRIMTAVEARYPVGRTSADRAFAGFSMGGWTTESIYVHMADQFDYFGIWSMGRADLINEDTLPFLKANADHNHVQLAWGDWDWCLPFCHGLEQALRENGIPYTQFTVPGSHDWRTWALILAHSCREFFFQ